MGEDSGGILVETSQCRWVISTLERLKNRREQDRKKKRTMSNRQSKEVEIMPMK